ncbi:MAG: glycolate oxidase subunit GlcE [Gammaproteobacteria bacterium]|nr:glycolate oxidase subunit GlcE [Gammaproteobacteria bacterium]
MADDKDISQQLADAVHAAAAACRPLAIAGGGTKHFYAGKTDGDKLNVAEHRGLVSYEPTELVITARAGTTLVEIESALAQHNQMLAFEPPHFGAGATLGGAIACGFSGPRRPYAGAARDFVLGTRIINGKGEILRFGGEVMKNVAGFDVSRLMVGAFGTLGVLLDISLKVLPKPEHEITLGFAMPIDLAITAMNTWAALPLPLSAACHMGDTLYIRLSGHEMGVHAAQVKLGGERLEKGDEFWRELREHERGFFQDNTPLWRLSVAPGTAPINLPGKWVVDWGGAQRWLKTNALPEEIIRTAKIAGGSAILFRGAKPPTLFTHDLDAALRKLHRNIKQAFDPFGILNFTAGTSIASI